jgi:DNA-directed RNA polymerase, mitochondrial
MRKTSAALAVKADLSACEIDADYFQNYTDERALRSERRREDQTGFGTTRQGIAVARRYLQPLIDLISADRRRGQRNKEVWRALRSLSDSDIAWRLLVGGITVSCWEFNIRDQALEIGFHLVGKQPTDLQFAAGAWGLKVLSGLSLFAIRTDGVLTLLKTDEINELRADVIKGIVLRNPFLAPLIDTPPEPWAQVDTGVFVPGSHWARPRLIRPCHRSVEDAVQYAIGRGSMRPVLDAVNSLQRVPFSINEVALDWGERYLAPPPPDPKRSKYTQDRQRDTRQAFELDMAIARWLTNTERFWVPMTMDSRGRLYGLPHFNFQREDPVRGLFLFANGEPIGIEGLRWLKAHVAGQADQLENGGKPSRLNFDERIDWVERSMPQLRAIAEAVMRGAPIDNLGWRRKLDKDGRRRKGDKTLQFVAACVELIQALDVGPEFVTRLPLTFDGSCSGLQHLCAMTRAPEGRFVNLTPSDRGEDIYAIVADRVGVDRAIVKTCVMTYFYAAVKGGFAKAKGRWQPFGMVEQVCEALEDKGLSKKGAKEIAHAAYDAIQDLVPKAAAVRDFLEKVADIYAKEGQTLGWTNALGLPVLNAYYVPDLRRISVSLAGRRRRVSLVVGDTTEINRKGARQAVTANFVHSCDAAHLQMVANAAAAEAINMVGVHDSFGCIAPRAKRFNEIIREQFILLHEENDMLAEILDTAKRDFPSVALPSPPEKGDLDLNEILNSYHAFK